MKSLGKLENVLADSVEATGDSLHLYDYQVLLSRFWFANQFVDDKDVVEFGGGSFICKEHMIAASSSYVVVDVVSANIEKLEAAFPGKATFLNEDCTATSLKDQSADVILALAMIYYCDVGKVLEEAFRILRPGGVLFFCTPNPAQPNFSPAPGSVEYPIPSATIDRATALGFAVDFYGAYEFGSGKLVNKCLSLVNQTMKVMLPALHRALRERKKGARLAVTNNLNFGQDFEKPVSLNPDKPVDMRVHYYKLTRV